MPAPPGVGGWFSERRRLELPKGVSRMVTVRQVHGVGVHLVDGSVNDHGASADAIVAVRAHGTIGLGLSIRVADCLPVLIADDSGNYLAVAHAGRVGLLGGVLLATVDRLRGLGARRLRAWIGPHICGSCYEVPPDMFDDAVARLPAVAARTAWDTPALDLAAGAQAQLSALEVTTSVVGPCTWESPRRLYSYRREGAAAGRQVVIGWFRAGRVY